MIKVLQVVGSLRLGGLETVSVNYFKYIERDKFDFTYLVYDKEEGELEETVKKLGGKIIRIPPPSDNYLKFIKNIRHVINEIDCLDIIHSHQSFNSGFVMVAAALERVPNRIVHSHTSINSNNIAFRKKIYNTIMRLLIQLFATKFIACSMDAGYYLLGKKFFSKFGNVILNSVNLEDFYYKDHIRYKIRKKLNLEEKIVIGHTGTLNSVKNQSFLIEIMSELLKINPNTYLILIGDGPEMDKLQYKAKELGIQESILFLGTQKYVSEYLMAMDVFVFPSKHEGLGIALIEAQITGLPCIISDVIPEEAIINNNIKQLSLNESEKVWASEIYSFNLNENRNNISVEINNYSSKKVMNEIYKIYS